ncbi:MAG: LytTR family DNA-binding domain-containing protein [Bacteroidetes bacterium]|nr:LytTR family DNA-binding domain-containing protein [Bacteroidota bacterium]
MEINSKIKCIIVEDEMHSRNYLRGLLLDNCKDIIVIDEVGTVNDAIISILKNNPDLVFLDIELAGENGFTILETLKDKIYFNTIFVTAYEEYAVKAFKFAAVSYLLKPYLLEDLIDAIERLKIFKTKFDYQKHISCLYDMLNNQNKSNKKIALNTTNGFTFVKTDDIISIQADGSYTKVYLLSGESILVCKNLSHFEEIFHNSDIIRFHKSAMINIKHIKKFIKNEGGYVIMTDNSKIKISDRKRKELMDMMKLI